MDLHVVELRVAHRDAGVQPTHETQAFREAGVYDLGGENSYAAPQLAENEVSPDPIETLGLMGGRIADAVSEGIKAGRRVVVAGGNCTALPGVIGGLQQALGNDARIGLVWFDAHGDFNTPRTSHSGMLGGMPVAVSAGLCHPAWRIGAKQPVALPTDRIIMVDVRNLDPEEGDLVHATDVTVVPPQRKAVADAVQRLAEETDFIYLHIDLDVLDESLTPSHRTKEPNGPGMQQTLEAVEAVLETGKVGAFGIVSIYPVGPGGDVSLASGTELLGESLKRWQAQAQA